MAWLGVLVLVLLGHLWWALLLTVIFLIMEKRK